MAAEVDTVSTGERGPWWWHGIGRLYKFSVRRGSRSGQDPGRGERVSGSGAIYFSFCIFKSKMGLFAINQNGEFRISNQNQNGIFCI